MKLRVHIEFIGPDHLRVTKFSGQKTISIKSFADKKCKVFDLSSFKFAYFDDNKTDFYIRNYDIRDGWDGKGTPEKPYVLGVFKINYDNNRFEFISELHAKENREVTVEVTLMPRKK